MHTLSVMSIIRVCVGQNGSNTVGRGITIKLECGPGLFIPGKSCDHSYWISGTGIG